MEPGADPESRAAGPQAAGGGVRLLLEFGPLVVFFVVNARSGIFAATGALMVALVASLAVSWARERRLPVMPLITAGFVLVLGGLTLLLRDELFIKLKPTIVNALLAAVLFGGLAAKKPLLRPLMDTAVALEDEGWTKLTRRFAWFFVFLALLNEAVWRTVSTDAWVAFKVWGIMPLTLLFAMAQAGLLKEHQLEPEPGEGEPER